MIRSAYVSAGYMKSFTPEDASMLDTVNIAFGHVKGNELSFDCDIKPELDRARGVNPELKFILSVGGWSAGGFSTMAQTEEGRRTFALSCRDCAEKYGFDGIDLDWEYPTIDWAGIDASPDDRENYTLLLRELRDALPQGSMLTMAAGCGDYYPDCVDFPAITPLLDYVSLMSYDMRGVGSRAGHHTGLYPTSGEDESPCADRYVKLFEKSGVPRSKQVLGAAFYSRIWKNVPDCGVHGLSQYGSEGSGNFGPGITELKEKYINKNGYVLYRDNTAPFLYKAEGGEFISFDDEESVKSKVRYIRENGLLGLMYWEHSIDKSRCLLRAMNEAADE